MLKKNVVLLFVALSLSAGAAAAFEPPLFPLTGDQLKAYGAYRSAPGEKAFAAGPAGQFSAQTGYASAMAAVREALAECDKGGADPKNPCIIIDQNGAMLPLALQLAQQSRADAARLEQPLPLRDLVLDADAWAALKGLDEKPGHKAFAISLKGPWARSWEASTIEEAEKEALAACDQKERAQTARCFVFSRDGANVGADTLEIAPDLSVAPKKQP
ncbi:MAG: hypothetical protein JNM20_18800 [Rhizobiales bacterium]|nr:hypothetical protein [Hyphomicrobiales bacterium]